ncbi:E3 ubiquitin-protein ligase TRIM7-like [Podarcis lilfordi]|uniref:RING-type E3 ubiquitin transferase n=1 Tax=Podarcis lilfordi TaxID=74358 RepID=A0AA35P1B5_9SAUR|nr:E3 ubiquitin-protein ligase TRIM7-like [Podarcis lilfordi]
MAAGTPEKQLREEVTCSICQDYFEDPVTTNCGHNFCRACLRDGLEKNPFCPLCRAALKPRQFKPNRKLANMVEIIRKMEEGKNAKLCKGDQEPCKLFCKDDQVLICVICNLSKEHRDHHVVPVQEAAQEYKGKIEAQIQALEKKRENILHREQAEDEKKQKYLSQVGVEKLNIRCVFKQMQKFLKENERRWLAQLGDLEREVEKTWKENVASLSDESFRLNTLISDMERKRQQPDSKFLQDIKNTLSRCQEGQLRQVVELSPGPEEGLRSYSHKRLVLKKVMEEIEESLKEALSKEPAKETMSKVNVILDPDTAHPFLVLSEDLTSVRWEDGYRGLPENPGRFDREFCVLGCERFTSGRHWWEVEVEEEEGAMWALGVARVSLRRKGCFSFSPKEGIWAVGKRPHGPPWPCQLFALTSPEWTPLALSHEPRKIRVSLDYEGGQLHFFDADSDGLIFAFPSASFSGERILPFFQVVSGVTMNC